MNTRDPETTTKRGWRALTISALGNPVAAIAIALVFASVAADVRADERADDEYEPSGFESCEVLDDYLVGTVAELRVRVERIDASDPRAPIVLDTLDIAQDSLVAAGTILLDWIVAARLGNGEYRRYSSSDYGWYAGMQRSQGELHITGFSSYGPAHGDDYLVEVPGDGTDPGERLRLRLFAVPDPAPSAALESTWEVLSFAECDPGGTCSEPPLSVPILGWSVRSDPAKDSRPYVRFFVHTLDDEGVRGVPDGLVFYERNQEQAVLGATDACRISWSEPIE